MRRLSAAAIVVLATSLGSPAGADVLIGAAGSITGPDAWTGEQMLRGSEMAVADLNTAGGVLGQQVRLITVDDFCDPKQAVVAAKKLVNDGVVFVVGHYCSGASIPASEIYERAEILQISPASTNPTLTEQGRANVFRVIGRDDMQGITAGNYLADNWADEGIAILHDDTTYGKGLAEQTKAQLNKRGVTERIFAAYTPGREDYSAEIGMLQEAGIAVAHVAGTHVKPALMVREARDRGYAIQLVSGDALATEEFGLIAGPAADGVLFTFAADPRRNPEAASVIERFRAEDFEPERFTLFTYAAIQVWAQAVENAGTMELPPVIAALRGHQFDTVLGPIDFDDKGDITAQTWVWYEWRDGGYAPLE